MYLLVRPNGSKYFRLKYRHQAHEKLLALGIYPEVSFKRAREKRDDARRLILDGKDPAAERAARRAAESESMQAVADALHEVQRATQGRTALWSIGITALCATVALAIAWAWPGGCGHRALRSRACVPPAMRSRATSSFSRSAPPGRGVRDYFVIQGC